MFGCHIRVSQRTRGGWNTQQTFHWKTNANLVLMFSQVLIFCPQARGPHMTITHVALWQGIYGTTCSLEHKTYPHPLRIPNTGPPPPPPYGGYNWWPVQTYTSNCFRFNMCYFSWMCLFYYNKPNDLRLMCTTFLTTKERWPSNRKVTIIGTNRSRHQIFWLYKRSDHPTDRPRGGPTY